MTDLIRKHYDKLIAFLTGWAAEALVDISGFIKSLLP